MASQNIEKTRISLGKPKPDGMRDTPPNQSEPPKFKGKPQNKSKSSHEDGIFTREAGEQDWLSVNLPKAIHSLRVVRDETHSWHIS
jgi:hypothetical protein